MNISKDFTERRQKNIVLLKEKTMETQISLRDYFAATYPGAFNRMSLQKNKAWIEGSCKERYEYADAMMEARERPEQPERTHQSLSKDQFTAIFSRGEEEVIKDRFGLVALCKPNYLHKDGSIKEAECTINNIPHTFKDNLYDRPKQPKNTAEKR